MEKPVRHKEGLIRVLGDTKDVAGDAHWMKGSTHAGLELAVSSGVDKLIELQAQSQMRKPATGVGGGSASDDGRTYQSPLIVSS